MIIRYFSVAVLTLSFIACNNSNPNSGNPVTSAGQERLVLCQGKITSNGADTPIAPKVIQFDPKQSKTVEIVTINGVKYQAWWDVSNNDGRPLLGVERVSTDLYEVAKASASDIVLLTDLDVSNNITTGVSCSSLGGK